jgi:hypothetical protein
LHSGVRPHPGAWDHRFDSSLDGVCLLGVGRGFSQAGFVGVDDGLGTVAEAELAIGVGQVSLDGGLGQVQARGDLAGGEPRG